MGQIKTKQLVKALVHDFLQTIFLIVVVMCVILYAIYYLSLACSDNSDRYLLSLSYKIKVESPTPIAAAAKMECCLME